MAGVHSTPTASRARRLCFGAIRFVVCLFAAAFIAADVIAGQPSLLSAIGLILCIEQHSIANSILNTGAALVHFLRNDHEAV